MKYSHLNAGRLLAPGIALLGLLGTSCQARSGRFPAPWTALPLAQLAPCTPPSQSTAGWPLVVDNYGFEFRLPPRYAEVNTQGIDSHVRHFATSDSRRTIHLDYGLFSSTLDEYRDYKEVTECRGEIGGLAARVVTARGEGNDYVAAVTWRDLPPGAHLTVAGVAPDRPGQLEIAAALWTMRFRSP